MYRSFSRLLQEAQANAAKKLGFLENALPEEFENPEGMAGHQQDTERPQEYSMAASVKPEPQAELPTLREHLIW